MKYGLIALLLGLSLPAQAQQMCPASGGRLLPCQNFMEEQFAIYAAKEAEWAKADAEDAAADDANRASDYWGAIAANMQTGQIHHVEYVYRPIDALERMKQACAGDRQCDLVAIYRNTCVALARGDQGELFWADDAKPKLVQQKAMNACKAGGANGCRADERDRVCSGYDYVDIRTGEAGTGQQSLGSKLRAFKRKGGLLGAISPKLAGKSEVQPPQVAYNPMTAQFLSQPTAMRSGQSPAKPDGSSLWMAYAFSRTSGARGTGIGLVEGVSAAQAKRTCGKSDCETLVAARTGECFAIVGGIDSRSVQQDFAAKAKNKELAGQAALKQCKSGGLGQCQVGFAECVKSLSEMAAQQ